MKLYSKGWQRSFRAESAGATFAGIVAGGERSTPCGIGARFHPECGVLALGVTPCNGGAGAALGACRRRPAVRRALPGHARSVKPARPPGRAGLRPAQRGALLRRRAGARRRRVDDRPGLLGINPATLPDSESWAEFEAELQTGRMQRRLRAHPGLDHAVLELSKIAAEPEAQRISAYSGGGSPSAIFQQTEKILCDNLTADPGAIPILNTYFLHPAAGACPQPAALAAAGPLFKARVDELAAAVDRRPAVFLLELDAIGSSGCVRRVGSLPLWESYLRYEIDEVSALPHTVVYVEGGYSDANTPAYTASVLNAVGIGRIRGFFTNDTHLNWTINEVRWATEVSRLTRGAHFIVNTAENGRGPLRNPHPTTQGNEDLCNPPGRGARPAADDRHRLRARRRLAVDVAAGQQQRLLQRRPAGRHLLAGAGGRSRRARERPPRTRLPEPALLSRGQQLRGDVPRRVGPRQARRRACHRRQPAAVGEQPRRPPCASRAASARRRGSRPPRRRAP